VVEDDDGKTYRAVYTVKFAGVVYVLHAFQKKSKSGSKTPPEEIEKVKSRLREAEKDYAEWTEQQKRKDQDDHWRTRSHRAGERERVRRPRHSEP